MVWNIIGSNVDYSSGPYIVPIPAGNVTHVSFEVKINNDNIHEGNETFNLTVNLMSLPDFIVQAIPYQTTVIIVDDDGNCSYIHVRNV